MNDELDDMYRDIILDHFRSPRGKKPVGKADIASDGHNPSCGDDVTVELEMADGNVKNVHVDCHGCAISVASASMLAEVIKGKSIDEVKKIAEIVKKMLKGEMDAIPEDAGDLDSLKGVRKFPVRIKCALLAWTTLVEGVKNYESGHGTETTTTTTEDE